MPKTILLIEDEAALQKAMGDAFKKEGYEVVKALDGELGFSLAEKLTPELIILDLILPKMDGFEVLKKLKETPATKNIPVIVLTNLERTEDVEKAIELGARTYLVKANYSLEEVLNKVKQSFVR